VLAPPQPVSAREDGAEDPEVPPQRLVPRVELVHPLQPPPGHARPAPEFRLDIADADKAGARVAGRGRERGAGLSAGPQEDGGGSIGLDSICFRVGPTE
jgi:hypothetical protein